MRSDVSKMDRGVSIRIAKEEPKKLTQFLLKGTVWVRRKQMIPESPSHLLRKKSRIIFHSR